MEIRSYSRNLSKSSVVFSVVILRMVMNLRLMYSPVLLRNIAQVLLLNQLPSKDQESGDATESGKKLSPG